MAYESYCAACTNLNENIDGYKRYYCRTKGAWVYANDPKCGSFCEAYSRSNSGRENMYNAKYSSSNGGCYLTTAMCQILNYSDNNYYLQTLRTFRDNVLKLNVNYLPLLVVYDTIGPQIAENLLNDQNNLEIATTLFNRYITSAVSAIENNKIEDAINIYVAMTNLLAERYNINTNIIMPNIDELNVNELGHGRTKIRRLEKNI